MTLLPKLVGKPSVEPCLTVGANTDKALSAAYFKTFSMGVVHSGLKSNCFISTFVGILISIVCVGNPILVTLVRLDQYQGLD